jgi:integrase
MYLSDAARTLKTSTLQRRLSAIAVAHMMADEPNPAADVVVRTTWAGIRRAKGTAQVGKDALLTENVRAMITALPNNLLGQRDACLPPLGFASAMRRSELVALDVDMITDMVDGLVVSVVRSKTDQKGVGRLIGVPYGSNPMTCPVRVYRAWLAVSGIENGPVFRPISRHGRLGTQRLSDHAVALIVKRSARAAGLDPAAFAGHSLRPGMATSASRAGASEADIMCQTGHRSLPMVRRYIRRGSLFNENTASQLGL